MKTTFEVDPINKGHKHSVDHECFNYASWQDYLDSKSNYHFDKWRDDSNHEGINLDVKFRFNTDLMQEILPFVREGSRNVNKSVDTLFCAWWENHNAYSTGLDHINYKESVKPEKHPTIQKIVDWYEFEDEVQSIVMQSKPGMWDLLHCDTYDGHPSGYGAKNEIERVIIQLTDWEPGQFALWGNKVISQWRAGDAIHWDKNLPHAVGNSSRFTRYALRITGIPSNRTLEKLKLKEIVNIE